MSEPERSVETYLFEMPTDPEAFICALAAVQGLLSEVSNRKIEPHMMIVCEDRYSFLLPALGSHVETVFYEEASKLTSRNLDLAFRFDVEKAKAVAAVTCRHMAQAFAIMLGGEPRIHPDLSAVALQPEKRVGDVFVLPWEDSQELVRLIDLNFPDKVILSQDEPLSLHELWKVVSRCKMVVGMCSIGTMLAACAGCTVIEIYPPSGGYREWLAKAIGRRYCVFYEERPHVTLVYRALERIWRSQGVPVKSTQMGQ